MDNNGFNGTEPAGYGNTSQKKQKSRLGLGILIGVLISVVAAGIIISTLTIIRRVAPLGGAAEMNYEEKLNTIQQYLDEYYMGTIDEKQMQDSLAKGYLKGIGDDYAEYYSKEEFAKLLEDVSGVYAGIGISIMRNDAGQMEVYKVFKDTPADEAGLHIKDIIVEAGGEKEFETVDDLANIVRGPEGTTVDIVIERDGEKIPLTIERRTIDIPTVEYKMLEGNIGYIQITEFDTVTESQFNDALDALDGQGATALILDLRDNPGGDYDTVVSMCDRVLPKGDILTVEDKNGIKHTEKSDEEHKITLPMAVIINENSASASEVFTGAIQDYDIATIVGKTSYGKGIVQSIYRLPDGSGMKFTTERYLTPKGRDINGIGIKPDVEVELPDEVFDDGVVDEDEDTQLKKAIEVLAQIF